MPIGEIFNLLFVTPLVNLLVFILQLLQSIHIPGALGFSIILFTFFIKILLWPLMTGQLRSAKKMMDLKPHLDNLKKKHQGDKQALSAAQMALYKEHGVNPAGGCLPTLLQIPVFFALVSVIPKLLDPTKINEINNSLYPFNHKLTSLPDSHFFGINLTHSLATSHLLSPEWIVLGIVTILTVATSFIQAKMMSPVPVKEYPSDSPKEKKEKESTEDVMAAMQPQMLFMMPLMIGFFSYNYVAGLSLYWIVYTVLNIWQQHIVSGWGGLDPWIQKLKRV